MNQKPIGVFDSGIGGITVLKELMRHYPSENFIYLGDTARLPYGSKSADTVRKYCEQNMEFLFNQNVKAIVIACNTASTQIFESEFKNIMLYNVIDPGAKVAVSKTKNLKVAVLATRATISAGTYSEKIKAINPNIKVHTQACPLFVPLAEEGWHDDPITNLIAYRYLQNLKSADVDTVVLGCTHYPLLRLAIAKVFGNSVQLVDSGEAICDELASDFKSERLVKNSSGKSGTLKICLTDAGSQFENLSLRLLSEVSAITPQFETVSVI